MILSCSGSALLSLDKPILIDAIIERRVEIRYCRDQRGDDRCFLDDYRIWSFVSDTPPMPKFLAKGGMRHCEAFYEYRRSETVDEVFFGEFCEVWRWDGNLHQLEYGALFTELFNLQRAIVNHRDVEIVRCRPRTLDDDRRLFRKTLPELIPGDFRLPPREEFLVSHGTQAGCPAFWQSHSGCGSNCNLHEWGPCNR